MGFWSLGFLVFWVGFFGFGFLVWVFWIWGFEIGFFKKTQHMKRQTARM
jgi:hypothetical protein